jgi:hypothetical protein
MLSAFSKYRKRMANTASNLTTAAIRFFLALFVLFFMLVYTPANGAEDDALQKVGNIPYRIGGDLRLRQVYFDNIPYYRDTYLSETNFLRLRTRLWAEVQPSPDVTLRTRLVNDFRYYFAPAGTISYRFPDEIFVDQLYVDVKKLSDGRLDLRIGRQEMRYGTGKIIANGTPKSSGRTEYFDAAKMTWKGIRDTEIDIIGIYDRPTNDLVINPQGRDLTGYPPWREWMTEAGLGIYIKNKTLPNLPLEAYSIYKRESGWEFSGNLYADAGRLQIYDPETNMVKVPALQYNTFGMRIMPKVTETLEGNFEAAYQVGNYDGGTSKIGYMTDFFLKWKMPFLLRLEPVVGAGWYYTSGRDPYEDNNAGWDSPFARWAGYSLIYETTLSYEGGGRWSNVNMYYGDLTVNPFSWLRSTLLVGYLLAPVKDGGGDGNVRGWLASLQANFRLAKNLLRENDALTAGLKVEILRPGDYYPDNDLAYYARWELTYSF